MYVQKDAARVKLPRYGPLGVRKLPVRGETGGGQLSPGDRRDENHGGLRGAV